jgi:hypothetical protein
MTFETEFNSTDTSGWHLKLLIWPHEKCQLISKNILTNEKNKQKTVKFTKLYDAFYQYQICSSDFHHFYNSFYRFIYFPFFNDEIFHVPDHNN